jgi:aminomethyltransferase
MDKHTVLTAWHQTHHGQMVSFGGFLMPVQYQNGILHEHHLVRTKAGLFDVSHMGEFTLKGKDALSNLNYLLSNDFTSLEIGNVRYGVLLYPNAKAVDDVLVYHTLENEYLLVVNASNIDKDEAYLKEHLNGDVEFENVSSNYGLIALQGPLSEKILSKLSSIYPKSYYSYLSDIPVNDITIDISRTGYTGEDGFEIFTKAKDTVHLWEMLLELGKDEGLEPCGLGARDTLRLEAGMPLYGHELSEDIGPLESGLKMFTKLDKEKCIAEEALKEIPKRRRIGLELIDRGIARENYPVYCKDQRVGHISSGTHSPTLQKSIAMAIIDEAYKDETLFEIDVRSKRLKAQKVKLPFVKK